MPQSLASVMVHVSVSDPVAPVEALGPVPTSPSVQIAAPPTDGPAGFALYRANPGRAHCFSVGTRKSITAAEIDQALHRVADAIAGRHAETKSLVFLGIANGGIEISRRLSELTGTRIAGTVTEGVLDVSFHRDDLGVNPIPKVARETHLPATGVDSATVVLVDDVLFSGRTVRAAMEEVFSHGRPTRIELAVLVDRGNRRLPIGADYVGFTEETTPTERVRVALDEVDASRDLIEISAAP